MLTLNEKKHEYRWDGNIVPSVTQIIGEWIKISFSAMSAYHVNVFTGTAVSEAVFEEARESGKAIHRACNIIAQGKFIDMDKIDPSLIMPVTQFLSWINDYKPKIIFTEKSMYSEKDEFAGTLDIFCEIKRKLSLVELKTPIKNPMVGPQTAGYLKLLRESEKVRAGINRYELILPRDGGQYKFNPLNNYSDLSFFLSRLYQRRYEWKTK